MITAKHFSCKHINQMNCVLLSNVKQWLMTKCTYSVLSQTLSCYRLNWLNDPLRPFDN